ncbi:MAG: hypothetical protein ABIZ04_21885, partial [Opitutus sp.]
QILETAQRIPNAFGLSAAFVAPDNAEPGKARCSELISFDLVARPAANVGLFSSRDISGIRRIGDAVASNVDLPGTSDAKEALRYAKKPFVRRALARFAKVAAGATAGHLVGKKYGAASGAVIGAGAGLFFSANESAQTMNTAKTIRRLVASHRAGHSKGIESHTLASLDARLKAPPGTGAALIAEKAITPRGPVYRGRDDLLQFASVELDGLQRAMLDDVAEQAIDRSNGDPDTMVLAAQSALTDHVKEFSIPFDAGTERTISDSAISRRFKSGAYGFAHRSNSNPNPYLRGVAEGTVTPGKPSKSINAAADIHKADAAAQRRKAGLEMLANVSRRSRKTEFSGRWVEDDEPSTLRKVAGVAGTVAAVGAGAAYARGRYLAPTASTFTKIRLGSAANIATGKAVANGVSRVAAVLAGRRPN